MKTDKNIFAKIGWGFYFVLLIVTLVIPAMTLKDDDHSLSFSIIDLFSSGAMSLGNTATGSSVNIASNSFYGLLTAMVLFVPAILSIKDKQIYKLIALALSIAIFSFVLYSCKMLFLVKDEFDEAYSHFSGANEMSLSIIGTTFLLITAIVGMIVAVVSVIVDLYYKAVEKNNNKTDLTQALQENLALFEKGLITEEEYNSRRAKILG